MSTAAKKISLDDIQEKIENKIPLTSSDGIFLLTKAETLDLASLAQQVRYQHNPEKIVTYVVDTNLNYTNLCDAYCSFCAFYRTDPRDPSAYTYSVEQIMDRIAAAAKQSVTTVLMQGGLNSAIPFDYYVEMVKTCRTRFPDITPHFWSAPEISKMCEVSGKTTEDVLTSLFEAGQSTMPGGGSEILSNNVKKEISRFSPKNTWEAWADVHRTAHKVGFKTTATMMYGHLEQPTDIIETFVHIREIQAEALQSGKGKFTAFIPWSYKRENNALSQKVQVEAGPNKYLRIIAVARLMLNNVQHIQASWFSEGKKTGQVALHFGADDFGGTLFTENVMLAAGFYNRTTEQEIRMMIEDVGFTPAQRLTNYDIVQVFA